MTVKKRMKMNATNEYITKSDLKDELASLEKRLIGNFQGGMGEAKTGLRSEMQGVKTELRTEMQTMKSDLRSEIQGLGTELRSEMQSMKTDLRSEMTEMKTEIRTEISGLRTEMYGIRSELKTDIQDLAALMEERFEEAKRFMGVMVEQMTHEFQAFAEGFVDLPARVTDHHRRLTQAEVDIADVKALVGFRK